MIRMFLIVACAVLILGDYAVRYIDRTVSGNAAPRAAAVQVDEPRQPVSSGRSLTLDAGRDGHFQVDARIDGRHLDFIVDTGSSQTVVANSVTKSAHLAHSDLAQRQTTVCSTITVPLVHSGPWSIPGVTLHPQLVDSANFGAIGGGGTAGLLGSDQLKRFGWVIFDYAGGRMVLG